MNLTTVRIEHADCYWNNLFSDEDLIAITEYCEQFEKVTATAGSFNEESENLEKLRKTKISWIYRDDQTNWFFMKIESAVNKINTKYFGFDIYTLEVLQYTIYDGDGSHYDWHWDLFIGNELDNLKSHSQRKVSAVLQLSDPSEYEGGVLEIAPGGVVKEIEQQKGLVTIFPSFVPHRVTPVNSGCRKSLVAWFVGPDWR